MYTGIISKSYGLEFYKMPKHQKIEKQNPLFIPLKTEYYEAFKNGSKREELRIYGQRWNEKTCPPGRPVVLSKGYGNFDRSYGFVERFDVVQATDLKKEHREAVERIYGTLELDIAIITIGGI